MVSPDVFMAVVRSCDNMDEICTLQDYFDAEVSSLLVSKLSYIQNTDATVVNTKEAEFS